MSSETVLAQIAGAAHHLVSIDRPIKSLQPQLPDVRGFHPEHANSSALGVQHYRAGDKPGAEALSGLARAFFYAGARALLVSHWAVESKAAMTLTHLHL